jgi:pimeloyl-ACP methyl ester carboxylesterase
MRFLFLFALALGAQPPVVFVHGNGDDASKWMATIWLFESNGYPREKLHAVRFTHPNARLNDANYEAFRSSTIDQAAELSAAVTRLLLETRSPKVALIGSSRGGNTIRNYIKNAAGAAAVSHAILAGTPNHGVFVMDTNTGNEFNAKGAFLQQLNQGGETVPGVRYMTTRSDKFDKFAQPSGSGYDSPILQGAENVVLPGLDHREVAFRPEAFAAMFRFLTGAEPKTLQVVPEPKPVISGLITGFAGAAATNLPESGVQLRVFAVDAATAARLGPPLLSLTTGPDGRWGPLAVSPDANYEFELEKDGLFVRYFRSPFLRSSSLVNLRWRPNPAGGTIAARPQGYFSKERDALRWNGEPVPQVPAGLPIQDSVPLKISTGGFLELRGEKIALRPGAPGALHLADFNWD